MSMDQAALFLAQSILVMMGFVVITVGILIINNLLSKHWKPVKFLRFEPVQTAFMTQEQYDAMMSSQEQKVETKQK